MSQDELRLLVFEALFEKLQGNADEDEPQAFVGLNADRIVVMQAGGAHFAVMVLPATVGAPA